MGKENDFSRLEINLPGCMENYRYFRSRLEPSTRLLVLVKANAYGHGAVEFARMLEDAGADYLAVAYPVEGVELRQAGIKVPVLVLTAGTDFSLKQRRPLASMSMTTRQNPCAARPIRRISKKRTLSSLILIINSPAWEVIPAGRGRRRNTGRRSRISPLRFPCPLSSRKSSLPRPGRNIDKEGQLWQRSRTLQSGRRYPSAPYPGY